MLKQVLLMGPESLMPWHRALNILLYFIINSFMVINNPVKFLKNNLYPFPCRCNLYSQIINLYFILLIICYY